MSEATTSTASKGSASVDKPRWRQRVELWYLAYALLGATMAGLAPILLPLTVSRSGNAADVGLAMAAFNLGGLTAPVWGSLADRYRLHRRLLAGGLAVTAVGLAVFGFATVPLAWFSLALLTSIGAAASATVANLFIVEAHPQSEWDERIGWLQTFYGAGLVVGLSLAGVLSQVDLRGGVWVAAALTAAAILPGWLATHTPTELLTPRPVLLHPARQGEWAHGSPQRLFHHVNLTALKQSRSALLSPFGLFLLTWLLSFGGAAALFSLYPVWMQQVFAIEPGLSSLAFAVAAGLGLALYAPAGVWSEHAGPNRVLKIGMGLRLIAFLSLSILALTHSNLTGWLALSSFAIIVLAWSLLSVSGTAITARIAPVGEGPGMGIFNGITAIAGVAGAALGGWMAGRLGYAAVSVFAAVGAACGLSLALVIQPMRLGTKQ